MDINKFTTKSQEAMQAAETKAIRFGHIEVDGEHLLLAMLEQPDGLAVEAFPENGHTRGQNAGAAGRGAEQEAARQRSGGRTRQNIYNQPLEQAAYRCAGAGPEAQR